MSSPPSSAGAATSSTSRARNDQQRLVCIAGLGAITPVGSSSVAR